MEEHRPQFPVHRLCQIMDVTSRGYRAWRRRPLSKRQRQDMVILAHIREQYRLSLKSYGRPRMTQELQDIGLSVGHRRVGRLMRQNNIYAVRTRKHKVTTDSNHTFNICRTYWIRISQLTSLIRNGRVTSVTYGHEKDGYIWLS